MAYARMSLVTLVAERVLQDRLQRELRELGARGFTVSEVHGEGPHGARAATWEGSVKVETIVPDEVGDAILAYVAKHYFAHHALIAYRTAVDVVRPEKYR